MEPELITFKKFNDIALANALTTLLDEHGIEYELEESQQSFNPAFVYNEQSKEYAVKIKADYFTRVTELLNKSEAADINGVEKDYYLFDFTDEELMEILAKGDEWSSFDYQLARKLLTERGVEVNDKTIADLKNKRLEELKAPEPSQSSWIVVGYIFALAGGLLGIFIGWYLATGKKTLPDGNRVYQYNDNDRKQGKRIFYLSVVIFAISIIYKFYNAFNSDY